MGSSAFTLISDSSSQYSLWLKRSVFSKVTAPSLELFILNKRERVQLPSLVSSLGLEMVCMASTSISLVTILTAAPVPDLTSTQTAAPTEPPLMPRVRGMPGILAMLRLLVELPRSASQTQ